MIAHVHPTLCCGNFAIDFEGRRLLRDGEALALEPKAFAVLALLASTPGRAFSRDEILDAVWGHRHVTPGVLNRVMTMLRHALGEDAQAPRYLHTLHGVGYRFDLPVPAMDTAALAQPPQSVAPAQSEPSATDTVPRASASVPGLISSRTVRRRRTDRLVPRLFAVLALLVVAWFGWMQPWRVEPSPASTADASVATLVVLPLRSIGTDPRDAVLADGLTEELTTTLARVAALRVTSRTSAALAAAQDTDLAVIGRRLDVASALEGSVRSSDGRLRVSLRLVDIASGHTRWAQDYDRSLGDLLVLEREVAQAVSGALQRNLEPSVIAYATLSDPDRYLRYLLARKLLRTETASDLQKATVLFQELVEEDPGDARAHEGLADALYVSSFFSQQREVGVAKRKQAALAARRAMALNPELADPHGVLSHEACVATEWEQCLGLLRRAVELAPSAPVWRCNYAWRLAALGYLPEGLQQAEAAIEASPLQNVPRWLAAHILDALGEHDLAQQQLLAANNRQQTYWAWFNAVWRHRYGEAMLIATKSSESRWQRGYVAVSAALQDPSLWPAAYAAIEVSEHDATGARSNWVRLLVPEPDIAHNLRMVEMELRQGHTFMSILIWAPGLAAHRRHPAFQDFLRRNHIIEYWQAHGWPEQCHPAADGRAVCN